MKEESGRERNGDKKGSRGRRSRDQIGVSLLVVVGWTALSPKIFIILYNRGLCFRKSKDAVIVAVFACITVQPEPPGRCLDLTAGRLYYFAVGWNDYYTSSSSTISCSSSCSSTVS